MWLISIKLILFCLFRAACPVRCQTSSRDALWVCDQSEEGWYWSLNHVGRKSKECSFLARIYPVKFEPTYGFPNFPNPMLSYPSFTFLFWTDVPSVSDFSLAPSRVQKVQGFHPEHYYLYLTLRAQFSHKGLTTPSHTDFRNCKSSQSRVGAWHDKVPSIHRQAASK